MTEPLDLHAIYVEYDNIHFLSGASVTAAWTKIARHVPALLAEVERLRERPAGVYVVEFSNYQPAEICAMYDNRAAAEAHADALDGDWRVSYWPVGSRFRDEGETP